MPHYLEPLVQELLADAHQFVDQMDEARNAVLQVEAVVDRLNNKLAGLGASAATAASGLGAANHGLQELRDISATAWMSLGILDQQLHELRDISASSAAMVGLLGNRLTALAAKSTVASAATGRAANGLRIWGTGLRVTGMAIHALVSGAVEILAVGIPAAVALAAGAFVAYQGVVESVVPHMHALYGATEATAAMFKKTSGDVLGLGHHFQTAQNAAMPLIYQTFGSGLAIAGMHMQNLAQTGLQVVRMFDLFAAKLRADFQFGDVGGRVNGLLKNMVPDLREFGQVLGNVGHAVVNLASDMPGLAEVMLRLLDSASRFVLAVSGLPAPLIKAAFALHEFNIWGSVASSLLGRMGAKLDTVKGSYFGFARAFGIIRNVVSAGGQAVARAIGLFGSLAGKLGLFSAAAARAGGAAAGLSGKIASWAMSVKAGDAALVALAAAAAISLGVLIYKMATAKSGWGDYAAAQGRAAASAKTNVGQIAAMGSAISTLTGKNAALAGSTVNLNGIILKARVGSHAYNAALQANTAEVGRLSQGMSTAFTHGQYLARLYHISLPEAMALADQAGVKLGNTVSSAKWRQAKLMVDSLVRGYKAMGAPAGAIGKDVEALAIQSGLATTKVEQLNQAWDQFMGTVTGGTSSLGAMVNSIQNIGQVTVSSAGKLGQYGGQFQLSMGKASRAMTGFGQVGSQVWQNFDTVLNGSDQQLADWLRTAGAMGTVGKGQFTTAFRAMVAQLLPFTAHSKTAVSVLSTLAQQAGGPNTTSFKKLKAWVDSGGHSMKDLAKIVQDGTQKLGDMASVAQNLGTVMNDQVASALSNAALKARGFFADANNLSQALAHSGTYGGHTAAYWAKKAADAYRLAGNDALTASGKVARYNGELAKAKSVGTITTHINTVYGAIGAPAPIPFFPGQGHGGHRHPAPVNVHIHGSSMATHQQIGQAVQTALNQKTIRNGSTQLYITGRRH